MDTCFLFAQHLDENGCLCLRSSASGELIAPLLQRSFAEIKSLQSESKTLVIENSEKASFLQLELPWLSERKARVAVPYAPEEKIAQPLEQVHFAFDRQRYQNNHYLITAVHKQQLDLLIQTLDKHHIEFDCITLDWFALEDQMQCVHQSVLLVNNQDFKGALSGELAASYLKAYPQYETLVFQNSAITVDAPLQAPEENSYLWIAKQFLNKTPLNLCQGTMLHGKKNDWITKGYQIAGLLCGIWLVSMLLVSGISLYFLNYKTAEIDQKIATIYHQFFPNAKQVISPRFRIGQLLGSDQSSSSRFWFLINQLTKGIDNNIFSINQLSYQNKSLQILVVSPDFSQLERLEKKLRQLSLNVTQIKAATEDQHVIATLELK